MEVTMKFNLPEDQDDLELYQKAINYFSALQETASQIFRPARKHGYADENIKRLVNKIGDDAIDLIGLLEDKFYKILEEDDVKL